MIRCVLLLALVVVFASVDIVSADGDRLSGKVLSTSLHDSKIFSGNSYDI